MTDKREARENLAELLFSEGYNILTKPKLGKCKTYFKGLSNKIFVKGEYGNTLLYPEQADTLDDIASIHKSLKEIKSADTFPAAYAVKGGDVIEYRSVVLANEHSYRTGCFYPFDDKGILSKNLLNILSVIRSYCNTRTDLGYLSKKELLFGEKISRCALDPDPGAVTSVERWFKDSSIETYSNLDNNSGFEFSHKGLLIRSKNEFHFVIVSAGDDSSLLNSYLCAKKIRDEHDKNRPKVSGNDVTLESIVIATPFSREGKLFKDDVDEIDGQKITHDASIDFMPPTEYIKSFQYCRLPFILFERGDSKPFINTMLSRKLYGKNEHPVMSTLYAPDGKPHHKFAIIPSSL